MRAGSILRASLIFGVFGALLSAVMVHLSGAGVGLVFAAYSLGGAVSMLGMASVLVQPASPRKHV